MCKAAHCGRIPAKNHQGYCIPCYMYFVTNHGEQYEPAEAGKLAYAPDGKVICHICGRAFKKLGQHVLNFHGLDPAFYRKEFNLNHNTKLTEATYAKKMKDYNEKYKEIVVNQNLLKNGKRTRIKKGELKNKDKNYNKIQKYTMY